MATLNAGPQRRYVFASIQGKRRRKTRANDEVLKQDHTGGIDCAQSSVPARPARGMCRARFRELVQVKL